MTVSARASGRRLCLEGQLTLDTVSRFCGPTSSPLTDAIAEIDLSGLTRCDSAGVALLLDWVGQAEGRGQSLTWIGVPAGVRALLDLYDIDFLAIA
ncbi:phospholipid transport system transporter-binding protein [Ferrimonas sediminum]|uniref:Phospholipid transport system transporter-binding protein n=1 Tax=Ferrimonas sediminum TaxID=718193 RepID=A0A1G8KCK7_9GAMM|nr:STAS domain-containing protein [Ferrimonas sediminum]SDI41196.1 phospholipid transport system transporter-binding protein [Ferrimonas sediminum]